MLDTPVSQFLLVLMEVVGPLVLLAALIYGTMTWRKRSRAAKEAGDRQAKRLFQQQDPT
jgi:hypothetical protein